MSDGTTRCEQDYVRFSMPSIYYLPVFGDTAYYDEPIPCTLWARWQPGTGVLWLECVACEGNSFHNNQLSDTDRARFMDALVTELCTRYF
jgi:hypothetical protein